MPTETMHKKDLWKLISEKVNLISETLSDHPDLKETNFIEADFKGCWKFKDVKGGKPFVSNPGASTTYDRMKELQRVIRNEILPIFLELCKKMGFWGDGRVIVPSGKQLGEILHALNTALHIADQKKKSEAKAKRLAGIAVKQEKEGEPD
jgi:hypothetical protein